MSTYGHRWNTADAINAHSSNPEPFTWPELQELIGFDPLSSLNKSSLDYTSTQGGLALREIIVEQLHDDPVTASDVILTSGAQEGIFIVMNSLLTIGDQVIGFTPCFEPLLSVAEQAGAEVTSLALDSKNQWQINWQELEATINHKTKLLVINFPHNPTGTHSTETEFNRLIDLCRTYDCWLLSDEVFRGLEHDSKDQLTAAVDLYDKAISMGVMSKSLALPGIRLGWLTCRNHRLKQSLMNVKAHLSICQSSIDTHIAEAILPYSELIFKRNREIINSNKQWLNQQLIGHPNLSWQLPKAAATGYIQLERSDAENTAKHWLDKNKFMVMPGRAFLTKEDGFRLTLGKRNLTKIYQKILQSY